MDSARAEEVGKYLEGRLLLRIEPQAAELLLTASQRRKRLCNAKADDDKFFAAVVNRSTEVAETRLLLELALLRDCGSSHRLQSRLYGEGVQGYKICNSFLISAVPLIPDPQVMPVCQNIGLRLV